METSVMNKIWTSLYFHMHVHLRKLIEDKNILIYSMCTINSCACGTQNPGPLLSNSQEES